MIMISFLIGILIGSLLLFLPFSTADGNGVPYIDALFTATTSICVTGLVTLPTAATWSVFGQIVILILIQVGGLGIITIMSGIMISLHKRFGIRDRMMIQDLFNLNSMSGIIRFLKKVLIGTFIVEGAGALMYMVVFIPQFGLKGIWISVFHAVSAFCNAGIDIISDNSMCDYAFNPWINLTTSLMVILGGLGYVVWWDVIRVMKHFRSQKFRCFQALSLHSKLALSMTGILLLGGTAVYLLLEYRNPLTIGNESFWNKLQVCFFQSVTVRTAGFASIPQENLTNASAIFSLFLMLIGGSPVGTAGGIKTVTIAVVILSAFAAIKGRSEVSVFHRTIPKAAISKAVAVISISFMIVLISTVLLSAVTDASSIDVTYETVSATATVGLTRNLTPGLNLWGKLIVIVTMYLGRIGPISLFVAFNTNRKNKNLIKDPTEEISIG